MGHGRHARLWHLEGQACRMGSAEIENFNEKSLKFLPGKNFKLLFL